MFMDKEIFIALLGLIGISLGAFFSGFGYYLKIRGERLNSKKSVIFYLLEIKYLIKFYYLDVDDVFNSYLKSCEKYLKKNNPDYKNDFDGQNLVVVKNYITESLDSMKPLMDSEFIQSYERSLLSLSVDDPVLAYKLKGRHNMNGLLRIQQNYISNLSKFLDDSDQKNIAISYSSEKNKALIDEIVHQLDSDLRCIARRCGVLTWISVVKEIKRFSKPVFKISDSEIESIIKGLIVEQDKTASPNCPNS